MADSTTTPTTHTQLAERHGPTGHTAKDGSGLAIISAATGGLGVAVGLIPLAGAGALILAVVALVTGGLALRGGGSTEGSRTARIGLVLGVAALVVGVLNIGIQLDWFTYFTTGD